MTFSNEYDEMDGYEKDDIPILDVKCYWSSEDFEDDIKDYNIKPDWVIIDNIVFKRKSAEEIKQAEEKSKKEEKSNSKIVRRKQ
jgi:hypothetical protein